MEANSVKKIHGFGQSIWLDFIDREIIKSGKLKELIEVDGIRGLTSNPAIFEKAISNSSDYDADIARLAKGPLSNEAIFYHLAVKDIQQAAELLLPIYNEAVKGSDGYASLEVSPLLAMNTEATVKQALQLWKEVNRKNVMIKIPGTQPGLAAIKKTISEGLNINVTLLFDLERYKEVTDAYIEGLEARTVKGESIQDIASVASFFLSRIDVLIDPILEEKHLGELKGEVAIASAKKAYEIYKQVFNGARWEKLAALGAKPQRLLWASTSSKNPSYKDTKYIEALIGPHTVDTVPMETLDAYRDHGDPKSRLEIDLEGASSILAQLRHEGIDLAKLTQQLEDEGIEKFNAPYKKLLNTIEKQKQLT